MDNCVTIPHETTDHRLGTGCLKVREIYQQLKKTRLLEMELIPLRPGISVWNLQTG